MELRHALMASIARTLHAEPYMIIVNAGLCRLGACNDKLCLPGRLVGMHIGRGKSMAEDHQYRAATSTRAGLEYEYMNSRTVVGLQWLHHAF